MTGCLKFSIIVFASWKPHKNSKASEFSNLESTKLWHSTERFEQVTRGIIWVVARVPEVAWGRFRRE